MNDGQIVTFDVGTGKVSPTIANGRVGCVNAKENLVTIISNTAQTKSPLGVAVFRWDSRTKSLTEVEVDTLPLWNPYVCLYTKKEDERKAGFGDVEWRYLERGDGNISWQYDSPKPNPVFLRNEKHPRIQLSAFGDEIGLTPMYFPFGNLYVLQSGRFFGSAYTIWRGEKVNELPMITMRSDGEIKRTLLSSQLRNRLTNAQGAQILFPTSTANLVVVPADANDAGGLYLDSESASHRIWCVPPSSTSPESELAKRRCTIESNIALSPDGCLVALSSTESSLLAPLYSFWYPTVKVLGVCRKK